MKPEFIRADVVSLNDVSALIDKAEGDATERIGVKPIDGKLILKWELLGRRLRQLAQAEEFAAHVAEQMTGAGLRAKPAVILADKKIFAGFFPVEQLAREITFR